MNDLETRAEQAFRDALSRQADAFEPTPLAPVRRQPHARRIGLIAVAASVLLVLGTTVGVALWRGSSADRGPAEDTAGPAAGWRYESYRDVQIEVPDSWAYDAAPGSDWCADVPGGEGRFSSEPYVDVASSSGITMDILCSDADTPGLHGDGVPERLWATHVRLVDPDAPDSAPDGTATDDGWTRITRTVGEAKVQVLADADHLDQARRVVESATVVGTDHNECPVASAIQADHFIRPADPFDVADVDEVDSISVCQYTLGMATDSPGLVASRALTGAAADDVLAAIKAAPVGGGPNSPKSCLPDPLDGVAVVLRLNSGDKTREMYLYNASCINNGFDDGTSIRELTRAACVPLYGERVRYTSGSGGTFQRCAE